MKRLANEKVSIPQGETVDETALKIANGEHEFFQTSTLMLNNKEKEDTSIAHIIYNKNTDYAIVYADFDISSREQEDLKKNNVYFINYHKLKEECWQCLKHEPSKSDVCQLIYELHFQFPLL